MITNHEQNEKKVSVDYISVPQQPYCKDASLKLDGSVSNMSNKINVKKLLLKLLEWKTYSFCFVEVIHTYVPVTMVVEIDQVDGGT